MTDTFEPIEQHLRRLKYLSNRLNETSDPFVRKSYAEELEREADRAGQAVKKYLEQNGDPKKIADFYKSMDDGNNADD